MGQTNNNPKEWLEAGLKTLDIKISPESTEQIINYFIELKKWSKKINLIGQADDQQIIENHFIDSLTMLPLIESSTEHLLDIGSGAGFPGLVLKMACPDLNVTLVEPRQKRVSFLNHICRVTKTTGIKVICQRIEENDLKFVNNYGQFSIITSRAVNKIKEFLSLSSPLLASGGRIICMKGPQAEQELEEWNKEKPENENIVFIKSHQLHLPNSKAERNLMIFTKNH